MEERPGGEMGAREGAHSQSPPTEEPLLAELGALGLELARWLRLRAERTRLALRRRILQALWALPIIAFGMTVAVLAGVSFARGVLGGARAVFERAPWLGELAGGALLFVALLSALQMWIRAADARELARLRAEHEDETGSES
jgi:hypothetical protein